MFLASVSPSTREDQFTVTVMDFRVCKWSVLMAGKISCTLACIDIIRMQAVFPYNKEVLSDWPDWSLTFDKQKFTWTSCLDPTNRTCCHPDFTIVSPPNLHNKAWQWFHPEGDIAVGWSGSFVPPLSAQAPFPSLPSLWLICPLVLPIFLYSSP